MAAGQGFKTFTTGEVLTAADTNGYLMQGVLVFASSAARSAAITSPQEGQMSYLKDTNSTEYYSGSAWTAVAAAGGTANWTLLNAGGTSLTGTSTSITGISGQDKLMIVVKGASHGSAADDTLGIQFNTDTANNYSFQGHYILGYTTYAKSQFAPFNETTNKVALFNSSTSAAESGSGYLLVSGANASGVKVFNGAGGASAGTGNSQSNNTVGGIYNSSSTISSVQIKWTTYSSTFDAGTVFIYGSA